jgi:hypothetical protein
MSDFSDFDDYSNDYNDYSQASNDLMNGSNDMWGASIDLQNLSSELWVQDDSYNSLIAQQMSDNAEYLSYQLEDASWAAYNGPVNAEGYTAHDAALGYTTQDTSFIEPASSAGSTSMISDYTGTSNL